MVGGDHHDGNVVREAEMRLGDDSVLTTSVSEHVVLSVLSPCWYIYMLVKPGQSVCQFDMIKVSCSVSWLFTSLQFVHQLLCMYIQIPQVALVCSEELKSLSM